MLNETHRQMVGRIVDNAGVRDFSDAMMEKLRQKRQEGRGGWHEEKECSVKDLLKMLDAHQKKTIVAEFHSDNYVDIANFCMMIWNRLEEDKKK